MSKKQIKKLKEGILTILLIGGLSIVLLLSGIKFYENVKYPEMTDSTQAYHTYFGEYHSSERIKELDEYCLKMYGKTFGQYYEWE